MKGAGCNACNDKGYRGRIGIYELIVADETFKKLIHDNAGEKALADHAFANTDSLADSGFGHVIAGTTSLEEVLRVVQQEAVTENGC